MLKFVVLSITLARPGTIMSVVREITPRIIKKKHLKKSIILNSNRECPKGVLYLYNIHCF